MGKWPLIPNTLPEKMLDAPLTSATLASVPPKNCILQPDMSTFTSTVVTTNTTKITRRENNIRTREESLKEIHIHSHRENQVVVEGCQGDAWVVSCSGWILEYYYMVVRVFWLFPWHWLVVSMGQSLAMWLLRCSEQQFLEHCYVVASVLCGYHGVGRWLLGHYCAVAILCSWF